MLTAILSVAITLALCYLVWKRYCLTFHISLAEDDWEHEADGPGEGSYIPPDPPGSEVPDHVH